MIFRETKIPSAYEVQLDINADERGFFARSWCQQEFQEQGLNPLLVQCSVSFNFREGTLRGMHYQEEPYQEAKLIRCTRGAVYDVVLDLRRQSPTFKEFVGVILTAANRNMMYVPEGCAHGFLTLEDETEVLYHISEFYSPDSARGVRWDDAAFGIEWPQEVRVISERDRSYPDFGL